MLMARAKHGQGLAPRPLAGLNSHDLERLLGGELSIHMHTVTLSMCVIHVAQHLARYELITVTAAPTHATKLTQEG